MEQEEQNKKKIIIIQIKSMVLFTHCFPDEINFFFVSFTERCCCWLIHKIYICIKAIPFILMPNTFVFQQINPCLKFPFVFTCTATHLAQTHANHSGKEENITKCFEFGFFFQFLFFQLLSFSMFHWILV